MIARDGRLLLVLSLGVACSKVEQPKADTPTVATAAAATPAQDTAPVITPNGFGKIRIGASLAELSTAIGTNVPAARTPSDKDCRYVMLGALPRGVRVMMVNDSVARLDVDAGAVRTAEGAGIGDAESEVVQLYSGRVRVTPHKYTGPVGHYVTVVASTDSLRRMVFETDGSKVLRFRAGRVPAVEQVEGCS